MINFDDLIKYENENTSLDFKEGVPSQLSSNF